MTHNVQASRFELTIDGHTAFADYRADNDVLFITHVEAPLALRGTGAAGKLMQGMLEKLRAEDQKVTPVCSYAAAWIRKHKEFYPLLAK
ncbi:MAG: GNAT family N-acetyltransferase [Rickettsiales bacterium]|nr:GNAT family N-acetyltransferase [Rickettsiales bacterium]